MELTPDSILNNRYKIIRKLGQGGMGAVFEAYDQTLETQVAVKTNFNPAPESVAQFLQEARLLASLKHPNLPRVTDYFVIGNEQFLVMDFIPGDDLGKRAKPGEMMAVDDVLGWSLKLSDALAYLHRQNPPVIHRDIKPANIKITPAGELFLVDFGIAKASGNAQQTAVGAAGYTPGFAPPEQFGQGHTGPYTDQFALAATMYSLLTGVKPVDSIQRLMGKALLTPVQKLNPSVPMNVADAIMKAMALRPEDRFPSMTLFRSAFNDPAFRLSDTERQLMASDMPNKMPSTPPYPGASDPTIMRQSPPVKSKKGLMIGMGIGAAILLCLGLVVGGLSLFVLNDSPNAFIDSLLGRPTSTNTTAPVVVVETAVIPTDTMVVLPSDTPVVVVQGLPTPTLTELPPTVTLAPTATETLELVGGSGMIVYVSDRGTDGYEQIWTMQVLRNASGEYEGRVLKQLTYDPGNKDFPAWSPDGSMIAYAGPGQEGNGQDIWVMNADGTNQKNITNRQGDEFDPVWFPDGSRIVFTHHERDSGDRKIYQLISISPDGSNRKRISQDYIESQATISPDGKYLVYAINASSHKYLYIRGKFEDFEIPRNFDTREVFGKLGEVADPEFAPEGFQMIYTKLDGNESQLILITYTNISEYGALGIQSFNVSSSFYDFAPSWSPDARWLALTSTRDYGDYEVYIMTTAGQPQVNLTDRKGIDKSPDWLPMPLE